MNITVLFPTSTEARHFSHPAASVAYCGVGLTRAAHATTRLLADSRPDVLILAGIAGVYPGSRLQVGDTVLVASEQEADLGFFGKDGFRHLADVDIDMEFDVSKVRPCPWLTGQEPLPHAHGNSLNAAMAPFAPTAGIDLENMEGAAFFHVCLQENQRFYEVRSISNRVTLDEEAWDFDASIRNLAGGLHEFIDWLLQAG
ncbi:phosphorylase family protein [Chitinilyticum aquatile]|uniref:phosphorylase family protein n=1 Tax=Chitinilyticum aquatile TaxID=362520 RepID=UPI00041B00FB|nr:hypothetical protein [Chitinilyticum aquatile]